MPLMRRHCKKCEAIFEQTYRSQKKCPACRHPVPKYRQQITQLQQRVDTLELNGNREQWQQWLVEQFEPLLGKPELNELIYKLLGRELEKVEA